MAKILGESPFSEEVTKLNDAQITWVLDMHMEENPELKESADQDGEAQRKVQNRIAWARVLTEPGRRKFYTKNMPEWKAKQIDANEKTT